jgi:hypothetical protein
MFFAFPVPPPQLSTPTTFFIIALLTNVSSKTLLNPFFQVTDLSGGNLLLSDTGLDGVGARLTPILTTPPLLLPQEAVLVLFQISLATPQRFTFHVNLLGVPLDF